MGLNNDTLQNIQNTAVEAKGRREFKPTAEPPHVYYLISHDVDGTERVEKVEADRFAFSHIIGDFRTLAVRLEDAVKEDEKTCVWYSGDLKNPGICAILHDDYRDRAFMPLTISDQLKMLVAWRQEGAAGVSMNHKSLFQTFRRMFRNSIKGYDEVMRKIAKVSFKKASELDSSQARAKTSLDRDMRAEAAGVDDLPEVLTFTVPYFSEAAATVMVSIDVAFDPDAEDEKFRLFVLPNQIEAATRTAEDYLGRSIEQILSNYSDPRQGEVDPTATNTAGAKTLLDVVPIYCGRP